MPRTVAPLTDTEIRKSKKKRLFDGGGLMLERLSAAINWCTLLEAHARRLRAGHR